MDSNKKTFMIAVIGLVIASLSMLGNVGNFLHTWWRWSQEQKTVITVFGRIAPDYPSEFQDYKTPIWMEDSRIEPPNPHSYKKLLSFFVECRITNLSSKNVTIADIENQLSISLNRPGLPFNGWNPREIDGVFLQGLFDDHIKPLVLPILLAPSEQKNILIKLGLPLHEEIVNAIKTNCPTLMKSRSITLRELPYLCRGHEDYKKTNLPEILSLDGLTISVVTSDRILQYISVDLRSLVWGG